jgi:hypothetical protein
MAYRIHKLQGSLRCPPRQFIGKKQPMTTHRWHNAIPRPRRQEQHGTWYLIASKGGRQGPATHGPSDPWTGGAPSRSPRVASGHGRAGRWCHP